MTVQVLLICFNTRVGHIDAEKGNNIIFKVGANLLTTKYVTSKKLFPKQFNLNISCQADCV